MERLKIGNGWCQDICPALEYGPRHGERFKNPGMDRLVGGEETGDKP